MFYKNQTTPSDTPQADTPRQTPPKADTPALRYYGAVRILLECILIKCTLSNLYSNSSVI